MEWDVPEGQVEEYPFMFVIRDVKRTSCTVPIVGMGETSASCSVILSWDCSCCTDHAKQAGKRCRKVSELLVPQT